VRIQAETAVAARRSHLFRFLADLENHWRLTGGGVEVVELTGPLGARTGGVVRLRGPLGIRKTVATQVVSANPPRSVCGSARLSRRTAATVRWDLDELAGDRTRVSLVAEVERVSPLDRLLLAVGGARWMRRLLADALSRLALLARAEPPPSERAHRGMRRASDHDRGARRARGRRRG
jgi:carbon monoxide dehydrogenase subunit G